MSGKPGAGADGGVNIGGSNGRQVQVRAARGTRKAKPSRTGFCRKRKAQFLAHFAATANAAAAARVAGVSKSTVYQHRRTDPQFHEAWNEALAQGYARVEALSVRWAEQAFTIKAEPKAEPRLREFDPRLALAILESYRRNGDRRPGEILPQPYDMEAVRARLEKKMRALGMLEEGAVEPGEGEGEEGPSTATRSPSPGTPREEN